MTGIKIMAKTYLNCYHQEAFQALNSNGITYQLEVVKHSFWGMLVKHKVIKIEVPYRGIDKTTEKWDSLIKSRKPLK